MPSAFVKRILPKMDRSHWSHIFIIFFSLERKLSCCLVFICICALLCTYFTARNEIPGSHFDFLVQSRWHTCLLQAQVLFFCGTVGVQRNEWKGSKWSKQLFWEKQVRACHPTFFELIVRVMLIISFIQRPRFCDLYIYNIFLPSEGYVIAQHK